VLAALSMINVHFSLLPRWRGAAPLERAILAGDAVTGVCVMEVEEGLDTGGVYRRAEVSMDDMTIEELRAVLVAKGTELVLDALANGLGDPEPQVGEPVYARKIDPAELRIDWNAPAAEVHRVVRAGNAWTTHRGKRLKVWRTAFPAGDGVVVPTGTEPIELVEVQPEGKGRVAARAWANGVHWQPDDTLGT
jgi:methionyl-tRNA formyltransferase